MKKMISIILAVVLSLSIFAACAPGGSSQPSSPQKSAESSGSAELPVLRIAVQPAFVSAPIQYLQDSGLDKKHGFVVEQVMFASGPPMNEALGAGLWDIATMGAGAIIAAVGTYDAKVIANHVNAVRGEGLYVRSDSDILSTKGFNPDYPELYGSPDTLKGKSIVGTTGTLQWLMTEYLNRMGLTQNDVQFINMELGQIYSSFLSNQGDICALNSQYSVKAPANGWECIVDFEKLNIQNLECIVASPDMFDNHKDLLANFLEALFEADAALEGDLDVKVQNAMNFNKANGKENTEEEVRAECEMKPYITKDFHKTIDFAASEGRIADFFISMGQLDASQRDKFNLGNNVKDDILKMVGVY